MRYEWYIGSVICAYNVPSDLHVDLALIVKGVYNRNVIAMLGALLTVACYLGLGIFDMDDPAGSNQIKFKFCFG